jgi:two-component system, cell cycle response regulator
MSNRKAMHILVVEDSAIDRHKISRYLGDWDMAFQCVEDGAEAWDLLQKPEAADLVLLDWMLPGIDGIELCHKIREMGTDRKYIYTIMLTAKDKKQNLMTAMSAGADDYLAKPVDPVELKARILVAQRILELQQSLRFAASHDSLTKLLSRAEVLAGLERELGRGQRNKQPVAVILADIDHFKAINDSLGHAAGDEALREVGRKLKSNLRQYDLAGRYGGEEFLIVLPNCNLASAANRAEKLRRSISENPIRTQWGRISMSVSFGVTAAEADSEVSDKELLQQADQALYRAKELGRNRIHTLSSSSATCSRATARV